MSPMWCKKVCKDYSVSPQDFKFWASKEHFPGEGYNLVGLEKQINYLTKVRKKK